MLNPFIVFEGIDGSGKSTQAQLLVQWYGMQGMPVLCSKEPTMGRFGRKIRDISLRLDPEDELDLLVKDREEHHGLWNRHLGNLPIILDRYIPSTLAYQGSKLSMDRILERNSHFPIPDLLLVFTCDSHISERRLATRYGKTAFEEARTLERAAEIYREILDGPMAKLLGKNVHEINGNDTTADVHQAVLKCVIGDCGQRTEQ